MLDGIKGSDIILTMSTHNDYRFIFEEIKIIWIRKSYTREFVPKHTSSRGEREKCEKKIFLTIEMKVKCGWLK